MAHNVNALPLKQMFTMIRLDYLAFFFGGGGSIVYSEVEDLWLLHYYTAVRHYCRPLKKLAEFTVVGKF